MTTATTTRRHFIIRICITITVKLTMGTIIITTTGVIIMDLQHRLPHYDNYETFVTKTARLYVQPDMSCNCSKRSIDYFEPFKFLSSTEKKEEFLATIYTHTAYRVLDYWHYIDLQVVFENWGRTKSLLY
jgi:hypothetical protein